MSFASQEIASNDGGRKTLVDHALQYGARGWPVFAVSRSKKPFRGSHGFLDATTDPAAIEAMWRAHPTANIAVATGHGLVVLDVDGPEGLAELKALVALHGPLPATLTSYTGRGAHLFFAYDGTDIRSFARSHLDVRASGGFVVLPPSLHPNGRHYAWKDSSAPAAGLEPWLKEWCQHGTKRKEKEPRTPTAKNAPAYLDGLPSRPLARQAIAAITEANRMVYGEELPRIKSALAVIPAVSREVRIEVGMILEDLHLVGENGSDLGLEWWDEFCQTSPEHYPGRGKLEAKWKGFGNYAGLKKGLGSLFMRAQEHGWIDPAIDHEPVNNVTPPDHEKLNSGPFSDYVNGHPSLELIDAGDLINLPAPRRTWLVDQWIPAADVTMLAGDGGLGKSILAVQLALAIVSNTPWAGLRVTPGSVLYIGAEDGKDEVHWRVEQIFKHLTIDRNDLHKFKFADMSQADPVMALFGQQGLMRRTVMYERIKAAAQTHRATCIILDAVADMFGGKEVERREVRAFIGLLRELCGQTNAAVIILAHPSVEGMRSGRNYSGSTAWNNSVRSRLSLTRPADETGQPENTDLRVLTLEKANRARSGDKIYMTWDDGQFVVTSPEATQSDATQKLEDEAFLACLAQINKDGRTVNTDGHTSAPKKFVELKAGKGFSKAALRRAMNRLLEAGKIRLESYGPPSRRYSRIVENGSN